jgi:hypothetical protein
MNVKNSNQKGIVEANCGVMLLQDINIIIFVFVDINLIQDIVHDMTVFFFDVIIIVADFGPNSTYFSVNQRSQELRHGISDINMTQNMRAQVVLEGNLQEKRLESHSKSF